MFSVVFGGMFAVDAVDVVVLLLIVYTLNDQVCRCIRASSLTQNVSNAVLIERKQLLSGVNAVQDQLKGKIGLFVCDAPHFQPLLQARGFASVIFFASMTTFGTFRNEPCLRFVCASVAAIPICRHTKTIK